MLIWGMMSTVTGIVQNFTGMVLVRFFLGFVEAAFLPGALLILSKWYTRRELTTRNAILFCGNLISNAFSALVGAGVLSNMQGTLGHAAWRWLFWIEGAVTMLVAIAAAFVLPDLPHNTRGFSEEERQVAQLRMLEDVGEADADSQGQGAFDGLIMAMKDVKVWLMMFTLTAFVVGLSFNAFFVSNTSLYFLFSWNMALIRYMQPTLTETLGYGYVPTLLLSSPPWVFSCLVSLLNAWHSDRTGEKFWHITGPIAGGLVGFIISMSTLNTAGRYVALFLQASSYAGFVSHLFFNPFTMSLTNHFSPRKPRNILTVVAPQFHRLLLVDLLLLPPAARQARRRPRRHQRLLAAGQRGGLVRLEPERQRLPQVVRHRDGHVRRHGARLLRVQGHAEPPEQEAGAGRDGRLGHEGGRRQPDGGDRGHDRGRGTEDEEGI